MLDDLPAPLTRDEEASVFAIIKTYVYHPRVRDAARNEIILRNARYVAMYVKGYIRQFPDAAAYRDDIHADLLLRMVGIIDSYDHAIGVKFISYLGKCLFHPSQRSHRRHALTVHIPLCLKVSRSDYAGCIGEHEREGPACDPSGPAALDDDLRAMRELIASTALTEGERNVLRHRVDGATLREIGTMYGHHREWARVQERKAIGKIRAVVRARGLIEVAS